MTSGLFTPVPADHPLRMAWDAYQKTPEFKNTRKWAEQEAHLDGSLWGMFNAGWDAALAQPARKPVATFRPCRSCNGTGDRDTGIPESPIATCKPCNGTGQIALAQPSQRKWVGLTDEEINAIPDGEYMDFYRAIEAKLKEKNGD